MKRKILTSAIALILSVCIAFGSITASAATFNIGGILSGLLTGGNINAWRDIFAPWLESQFGGSGSDDDSFTITPDDIPIELREGEAEAIATLFNLSVNELKKGAPAFTKTQRTSLDRSLTSTLQGGATIIESMFASLIGSKDFAAGVIDGVNGDSSEVRMKYPVGNDVKNNIPLTGKDYVSSLTAEDIKGYTATIYRSNRYRLHIDLIDVEGSAASSGLAHVFDTSEKSMATINFFGTSTNTNVLLKYVNNYVECDVSANGEITNYTMNTGITFMFPQPDGSYSSTISMFGQEIDFEEEGVVYNITTDISGIDFTLRKMGDANQDKYITSADARLVLRMSAGLEPYTDEDVKYCDVDMNKKLTAADARKILRASAKLDTLPTTEQALGIKEYERDESVGQNADALLVLISAYLAARDEDIQKKLEEYYENLENGSSGDDNGQGDIRDPSDTVKDIFDLIGDIFGWFR